jgi:methyl-accepting chemotaxis protein
LIKGETVAAISIRKSLTFASFIVGGLMLVGNAIVWHSDVALNRSLEESLRIEHGMMAFKDARFHVVQIQQYLTDAAAVGEEDFSAALKEKQAALAELDNLAAILPERQDSITRIKQRIDSLYTSGSLMATAYVRQGREAGNALMKGTNGFDMATEQITKELDALAATLHSEEEETERQHHLTLDRMSLSSIATSALALILILLSYFWLYRVLMRMLGAEPAVAGDIAQHISQGDLASSSQSEGDLPASSLLATIRKMQSALRETVLAIRAGADTVLSSAHRLNGEADGVVEGSRQQSDAAAAMSAAVEEMAVSISHVADNAKTVSSRAIEAGEKADKGGQEVHAVSEEVRKVADTVHQASEVIERLGNESKQITSIVDTIRDIADQTNLLALNAAIEAARAGEQGRGFAVVADEVRKLAERTTQSTQEIAGMVGSIGERVEEAISRMDKSIQQVSEGVAQAEKAYEAMASVRQSTENMIGDVHEIDHALQEQRAASNTIAQSVERIADMSEKNQFAVAHISEDARQLESLAERLEDLVRGFKT